MESLLSHMINLTAHRDHALFDIAPVSAAQELAGATVTGLLATAPSNDTAEFF